MKKIAIFLSTVFVFSSCSPTYETHPPKDLIKAQTMEEVLVDIYLLEASIRNCVQNNKKDSLAQWVGGQMQSIFDDKKINYQRFKSSYNYYMGHEKESQQIMNNVINQLIKKETEAIIQNQKHKKQDTLKAKLSGADIITKVISIKK